jgi:hypothetical protein
MVDVLGIKMQTMLEKTDLLLESLYLHIESPSLHVVFVHRKKDGHRSENRSEHRSDARRVSASLAQGEREGEIIK